MKSLLSLFAFLWKHPKMLIGGITLIVVTAFTGWQMIRAERAERKGAQSTADLTILQAKYTTLEASESALQQAIKSYQTAAAQELEKRLVAEKKARTVRIQTVERVKVIREAAIPSDCTAAIEYGATQGPIIAEWGKQL